MSLRRDRLQRLVRQLSATVLLLEQNRTYAGGWQVDRIVRGKD
jgi:hypothetical protein